MLSCVRLCDPMDCSTPGFPVLHYLLEFAQTHVHWVGDAIQLSHPLSSPFLPAFNVSQHQGLFQWVGSLQQGESFRVSASASVLPMNIQGWFPLGLTGLISLQSKGFSRVFSNTTVRKQDSYLNQIPMAGRSPGGLVFGIDDLSSTKRTYLLLSCICSRTALLQRLHQNYAAVTLLRARSSVCKAQGKVTWSLHWSPRI